MFKDKKQTTSSLNLSSPWTVSFPSGWGAPESLEINDLKAWKDMDMSTEGKAFSGTATYITTFDVKQIKPNIRYLLDLGNVEMIANVSLNGKPIQTLWAPPYSIDITNEMQSGKNQLKIEVTSTWFNRLVYDAGQEEAVRKTWVIDGPSKDAPLRDNGLLGPVKVYLCN